MKVLLAAILLLTPVNAGTSPQPEVAMQSGEARKDEGSIGVRAHEYEMVPGLPPQSAVRYKKPRIEYKPVCISSSPPGTCGQAIFCPNLPDQERRAFYRLEARSDAQARPEGWTNTGTIVCRDVNAPGAEPVVLSVSQFRRLPIPPARIRVQPDPASRPTLVNVETNLFTTADRPIMNTTVLGAPVRVRATPANYRWDYGDGATLSTTKAGGAYPNMPTAHVYARPGTYRAGLTTTFTGEFSVNGGPWQPVDGTAAVATDPVAVTVVEARAELVP